MFAHKSTELVQPTPTKSYDLPGAILFFEKVKTDNENFMSKIPICISRTEKPGALAADDENRLPVDLRAVGGPVSVGEGEFGDGRKESGLTIGYTEGAGDVEARKVEADQRCASPDVPNAQSLVASTTPTLSAAPITQGMGYDDFMRLSSPPLPPHKRHPHMMTFASSPGPDDDERLDTLSTTSSLVRTASPSQAPMSPGEPNTRKTDFAGYDVEKWIERTRACLLPASVWMRAPSPSEVPPPRGSGLARIRSMKITANGVARATSEILQAPDITAKDMSSGEHSAMANAATSVDTNPVESGLSGTPPYCTPSSSTTSLQTIPGDETQGGHPLHWNISMGGDAGSFLNANRQLQTKTVHLASNRKLPKVHWNISMGGDPVRFLLNAERALQESV